VPGIAQPVRVCATNGVCTVYAHNQHEPFPCAGGGRAQDRPFSDGNLEQKRYGQEGLSGTRWERPFCSANINARRLQYRGDMQKEYASYFPDTKAILMGSPMGLNAYIATAKCAWAAPGYRSEFQLLGIRPDSWRPEIACIAWRLFHDRQTLSRAQVARALSGTRCG